MTIHAYALIATILFFAIVWWLLVKDEKGDDPSWTDKNRRF